MTNYKHISERIKSIITLLSDGNNSKFAKDINTNEANVRNYISGKSTPKYETLLEIINKFEINCEWLLTGDGDMLRNTTHEHATITEVIYKSDTRDTEMIEAKNEIIEIQKKLILSLEQRIKELERGTTHHVPDAFTSARSAVSTGVTPTRKTTK